MCETVFISVAPWGGFAKTAEGEMFGHKVLFSGHDADATWAFTPWRQHVLCPGQVLKKVASVCFVLTWPLETRSTASDLDHATGSSP